MRRILTRTTLGTGLAVALFAGAVAPAAQAAEGSCAKTAEQRAAVHDEVRTLRGDLRGDRLTKDEKQALRAAVAESLHAARDAKMSRAVRKAKRAEFAALARTLRHTGTAEERTAVRAEMRAIRLELKAGHLTRAERRELRDQVKDLRRTLRTKLTKGQRTAVRQQIRALRGELRCTKA
jgi:hypothetical protein